MTTSTDRVRRSRPTRSSAIAWAAVVVLVAVRIVAVVVLLRSGLEHRGSILGGDTRRYLSILHDAGTPYRDRAVEYTPLTLGFLWLVDRGGVHATLTAIAWSQLALELGIVALLWWAWSRRAALWYLVIGTPMLAFPFPYARVDMLSTAFTVLAFALLRRVRQVPAGLAFAVAMLTKIWPVAMVPVLLVRRRWRDAVAAALGVAVGLLAWWLWAGSAGFSQVLSFRGAHGWQIESTPGIIAHALDPATSRFESGAWRSGVTMPSWARALLVLATVAVVAWGWWRASSTDRSARDGAEGDAALLAVIAMLALAPILSPQYILWMLPFAAIVAARGDRVTAAVTIAISALTTAGLAYYRRLLVGDGWVTAIVLGRNALLVALGLHLAIRLHRRPTGSRSGTSEDQPTFAA